MSFTLFCDFSKKHRKVDPSTHISVNHVADKRNNSSLMTMKQDIKISHYGVKIYIPFSPSCIGFYTVGTFLITPFA